MSLLCEVLPDSDSILLVGGDRLKRKYPNRVVLLLGMVVTQRTNRDRSTGLPFVSAAAVRDFLVAYYRSVIGQELVEHDPFLRASLETLRGCVSKGGFGVHKIMHHPVGSPKPCIFS